MAAKRSELVEESWGFRWEQVRVSRLAHHITNTGAHRYLRIETPRQIIDLRITPTGLIRVGDVNTRDGKLSPGIWKKRQ